MESVAAVRLPSLAEPIPATTERLLAAANLGAAHVLLRLWPEPPGRAVLVSSTDPDRETGEVDPDRLILLPGEVVLLRVDPAAEPDIT